MPRKNKTTISIKGLHCRSCELLVEDHLKEINGIDKVEVSYSRGEADIYYTGERPSDEVLKAAVLKAGYNLGKEGIKGKFIDLGSEKLWLITGGIAIVLLILIIARALGISNIDIGEVDSKPSIGMVLVIGLIAGVSTCMAIVGGIILSLSAKFTAKFPSASSTERLKPNIYFIIGRLIGYSLLGGLLGVFGSVIQFSSAASAILTMFVGALMLVIGLQLIGIFPWLQKFSFSLPPKLAKLLRINRRKEEYSHRAAAVLGALTFFLPCGFTQAMQVYAVSRGNFVDGAMIMGVFALGTAPGIFGLGGVAATIKKTGRKLFFASAGIAVILFGAFNFTNAYKLISTESSLFSSGSAEQKGNGKVADDVQTINMIETNRGYSPNRFTVKKGIPVKWVIDAQAPYSCASALVVPQLKIRKFLEAGENIIEFTPDKSGPIKFSCSMGMYTGVINVID